MNSLIIILFFCLPTDGFSRTWSFDQDAEPLKPKRNLSSTNIKKTKLFRVEEKGNLPDYAVYKGQLGWGEIKGPISIIADDSYYIMRKVKAGDQYKLALDNVIYAIEGKEIPVTGTILSGELMGSSVVGHTRLEPYSRKIVINFTSLVDEQGSEYTVKSFALRHGDQFFTPSRYISKKSKFLVGRVLTAFGASFLESKIQTNQTLLGQVQRNDAKSSSYSAGRDGMEVASNDFRDALNNSKDVAYIAKKMMYEIQFLNSPKSK
jgi:hypothetical protein